jgi:hypothetical protein
VKGELSRVRPAHRLPRVDRHAVRVEGEVEDVDEDIALLARAEAPVTGAGDYGNGGLRDQ